MSNRSLGTRTEMGPETNSANNEPRGIVAVGASASGVEALTNMAAGMPRDFPFAVVVVLHMPPGAPSVLAKILDRSGPLPACSAVNGMRLKPGQIHVAVPDHHLLIEDHRAVLSAGPTENRYRPAINALFRSAALAYGPRAIGLLLSGGARRRSARSGGDPLPRWRHPRPTSQRRAVRGDAAQRRRSGRGRSPSHRGRSGSAAHAACRSPTRG